MLDGPFRAVLPRFTTTLIRLYGQLQLTPNHVTISGLVCAVSAAGLTAVGLPWGAIAVWWLGRIFDGTDGIYARESGQVTPFGGYLDVVVDMAAYGVMVIGFAVWQPQLSMVWLGMMFMYVLCITSALAWGGIEREHGLDASTDNRTLRLAAGLAEGGETGIAYTLFLMFPAYLPALTGLWLGVLFMTVLTRSFLARRAWERSRS